LNNTILKEQQKEIWQTHANKRSLKTKRIDAFAKKIRSKNQSSSEETSI
jgi:hypothetical protein